MTLDGVSLPALDHAWLHRQVAIVSQEPILFAESLFYNIAFGAAKGEASVSLAQVGPAVSALLPVAPSQASCDLPDVGEVPPPW